MNKKTARIRRATKARAHIRRLGVPRLTVHRSGRHIYAQVIAAEGGQVLYTSRSKELGIDIRVPAADRD